MKKIFPFIVCCWIVGCVPINNPNKSKEKITVDKEIQIIRTDSSGGGTLRFININEHQYIMWHSDKGVSICHDENCINEHHKK